MTVDCESLLSNPLSSSVRAEVRLVRSTGEYVNKSQKYRLAGNGKNYNKQYHLTYNMRLQAIRTMIIEQAKGKFGPDIKIVQLSDLREENDEERTEDILIVGTIFKQQENRPSILKEFSEDKINVVMKDPDSYASDTDTMVLEDENMRIKLIGNITPSVYVNGVVAGCWGREVKGGNFDVKELVHPLIPAGVSPVKTEEGNIALMSGLDLDGAEGGWLESAQLAVDWICGSAGGLGDQELASTIHRVIIAGDSLAESTKNREDRSKARYLTQNKQAGSVEGVQQLDDLLVQLAGSVATDLLPGENDPACGILPQQPLHKCMFPQASAYPTFQSVTNPYSCSVANREILVLSGETIRDTRKNSSLTDPVDILEKFLHWGHVAPTCPDTTGCYPVFSEDPFVISSLPDILIAGNQEKFGSKKVELSGKAVLIVVVPRFSSTSSIVQINLGSLEASIIEFSSSLEIAPEK